MNVLLLAALTIHTVITNSVELRWFEEMVPMRDGTCLYTYGVLPSEGEKCAIVLERNPYVKDAPVNMPAYARTAQETLKRGYAFVRQHVRGCGRSDGARLVYVDERNDGLDTLDWIRRLPHYNGEIFLSGLSYLASVHWSYLGTNPPDVKGACLLVQDVNRYNIHYRNGNYKAALHGGWVVGEYKKKDCTLKRDPAAKFTDLPLKGFSIRRLGEYVADLEETWEHPRPNDAWWKTPGVAGGEYRRALLDSTIPVMIVSGFYDIYTEGIFDMWRELPSARRANCALVVDDGAHGGRRKEIDSDLDWFDWCRGKGMLKIAHPGETTWYELWANSWHHASVMDDASAWKAMDFVTVPVSFDYDPRNPPNFTPVGCLTFGGLKEQPASGWRRDIATFEIPPFERDLHVRGRMKLSLLVKSDREDTTFYVRVSAKKSDGKWYNVRDDIKSILWDHVDYRPDEEVMIDYQLSDHAFFLRAGETLRVEVAGASRDQFIPHTNLKGPFHLQETSKIARNTILSGVLRLPIE